MVSKLTMSDAVRLCRICKSNGYFASVEVEDDGDTCKVIVDYINHDSDEKIYTEAFNEIKCKMEYLEGWKSKGKIYIPKTKLNEHLALVGIDPYLFIRWADNVGLIAKRGKKGRTSAARNGDKIIRCAIFYDIDSEEEC